MSTVLICVAIYLAFGWLSLFVAGMLDFDVLEKSTIFFFWPLVLMIALVVTVGDTSVQFVIRVNHKFPNIRRCQFRVARSLYCIKMILNPYELGFVVAKKIEQRKSAAKVENQEGGAS